MSKHTPGPWKTTDAISHGCSFIHISGPGMEDVAMTGVNQEKLDSEQRANASLIAAAPDLLELVKKMPFLLSAHLTPEQRKEVFAECDAAIAKAEGKL